ncbi:MAG: 50S ribosomal protein L25 [Firmicutes bacterium]|nr:50S ribosomal protein L25 [Bacillota bacterium]
MAQPVLKAQERKHSGTGASRQDRNNKMIPAVLYGRGVDSRTITVPESDLIALFNSGNAHSLLELSVGSEKYSVMIKDMQRNNIKGHFTHLDFYVVDMSQPINATVAVHLNGESEGVKAGGILQQQLREIDIRCLPGNLPKWLELDITDLEIGASKTVADVQLPDGVEFISGTDEVVVSVTAPRLETEEEGDTEEAPDAEVEAAPEETKSDEE